MKSLSFLVFLFVSFSFQAQENECVTIIDKSDENTILFDDSNPLSFVRVVDQSRFQLESMSRKTFETVNKLTSTGHFSFRLGPQSDTPITTKDGEEDSLFLIDGSFYFLYLAPDSFYYDLTSISRFILREIPVYDSLTKTSSYQIGTIDFAKRFPGSDQYFITASLDYQAFLKYKGYQVDMEQTWSEVFSGNSSLEEALRVMKLIAVANQHTKPGEKPDNRLKVLECNGIHDYMGDEPPNLTYRANSSNLKYNASFICPNLYTLTHELDSNHLFYIIKTDHSRPISDIGCGDTLINNMRFYKYPEYYWVMTDSVKTVFTYKAKNLSAEKLELESVSFIGQIDGEPCLLMRLLLNEPRPPKTNDLDLFMYQLEASQARFFSRSVNYDEALRMALLRNSRSINSLNETEWNQFQKEVFLKVE